MSLVVSFRLASRLLGTALSDVPAMHLRIEQEAALGENATLLTFRATGAPFGAFETALETDPTVGAVVLGETVDGERCYRVEVPAGETTYYEWVALGCVLLDATVTQAGWNVRMRFPDRDALLAYRSHCRDRDVEFSLRSVRDATDATESNPYGLTMPQYEILAAAIDGGYFEVPRGTRMGDLASDLDISDQAASERLRRGLSRLLNSLAVDEYYR